jgi:hypothetical protein
MLGEIGLELDQKEAAHGVLLISPTAAQ